MSNVFISHSSHDKPFVKRLASALLSEGFPIWLDSWKLEFGDSLLDKVYDGIDGSSLVLLVVSQHAIESGWVNREMNAALAKEEQTGRKFLIPIKIDSCQSPIKIADRLYADFSVAFAAPLGKLTQFLDSKGCRDLTVPPEREQLCLNFTRGANLDRHSFERAITHITARQKNFILKPEHIVMNEDKEVEILMQRLQSRVDNISTDKYYSPALENTLRHSLNRLSSNNQLLAEGISLFVSNYFDAEAIHWFARILRGRNLHILWSMQNPDSDVLAYGKEWKSADFGSNFSAASFFEIEHVTSVDFWRKESTTRSPHFHVWLDNEETKSLREYFGLPGDFGDISSKAINKFIYPQMVLQHLNDKVGQGPIIWDLDNALIALA